MKFNFKRKLENNVEQIKDKTDGFIDKSSKFKRIRLGNISRLRICVIIVILAVIHSFYGNSDKCLSRTITLNHKIEQCKTDIDSLNNLILNYKNVIEKIDNDDEFLEEYARKNYFMSSRNEDIIIVNKN
ncbi:MAG: septum formation initiator family protein [Bacteroidetes bacterium]|nr:septum formation initiator family protein [Bacteroidota bacterium]